MKKRIYSLVLLVAACLSLTSCLDDASSSSSVTLYDDTAIVGFGLGTLNRYHYFYATTTSSTGEDSTYVDSVYVEKVDCSGYKFTIDQNRGIIYNVDSLPAGLDRKHVVCSASAKNGGTVVLKIQPEEEGADSLFFLSTIDSLDFSDPVELRAYNGTLTSYRAYTVTINMHTQQADELNWQSVTTSPLLASLTDVRLFTAGNRLFAFGNKQGMGAICYANINDATEWHEATPNLAFELDADIAHNVAVLGNTLYMLNGSQLYSSADGELWNNLETNGIAQLGISQLVGAANGMLYARCENGLAASSDGISWTEEKLDADKAWLPTENITLLSKPHAVYSELQNLILMGNRNAAAYPNDKHACVWSKIVTGDEEPALWNLYNIDKYSKAAPRMNDMQVLYYNNRIYALGNQTAEGEGSLDFSGVYSSFTSGLTWQADTTLQLPAEMTASTAMPLAVTADGDHFLWVVSTATGQVWKGRLNQLGWRKES